MIYYHLIAYGWGGANDSVMNPKISIIMPVYNAEQNLAETIAAIQKQTFIDFEVICVDDESTDATCDILLKTLKKDGRFILLHQEHSGAGAARNFGLSAAKGEYVIFSDCDDIYAPDLLEKLYQTAVLNQADIVACNFIGLDAQKREIKQTGIHTEWIPRNLSVFNYRDCPSNILRITSPVVWNKMYRRVFLLQNKLRFDELMTCNDRSFVAVSLAVAERIAYSTEYLVRYSFPRLNNPKQLHDVSAAVTSAVDQIHKLPHAEVLQNAALKFAVESYLFALKKSVRDFGETSAAEFYQMVHELFNGSAFCNINEETLNNGELYREFCTVQKHSYENMKCLVSRRLIVSLTSYPKRIGVVAQVLNTIYAQTRKADEIILWLAEEQFPGKEADLPDNLRQLISDKRLTVRWCDDLKGHKKYFYALQEYQDDIVVTIDDDLLYPQDMLASLYKSYLLYPDAVSTLRAHLILVSEQNQILPYREWIHETDACIHKPCMQLMASGGAGDLYPPGLYRKDFFDREAVLEYCLWADNLWVKAMQLVSDVPVVLVRPFEPLRCVEEAQEETLYQINGGQNQYDTQMERIGEWLEEKFGPNILVQKLTKPKVGVDIHTIEAVSQLVNQERKSNRWKRMTAEKKLQNAENDLKRIQDRLRGVENQLQQTEIQLKDAQAKQTHTGKKLKQTEDKLRQVEESKPIKKQLGELGRFLRALKAEDHSPLTWWIRYLIYILAWIPEAILAGMMFYLENGFRQTVKYVFIKLSGRRK